MSDLETVKNPAEAVEPLIIRRANLAQEELAPFLPPAFPRSHQPSLQEQATFEQLFKKSL